MMNEEPQAMAADIVELLRRHPRKAWIEVIEPNGWQYSTNIGVVLHQAADEIERLRLELERRQQPLWRRVLRVLEGKDD